MAIKNKKVSKKSKIQPLFDRVLIKPFTKEELEKKSNYGIILPENNKENAEQGIIVAVGDGKIIDGKKVEVSVKIGDRVAFSKYGFDEIKIEGEEYYLIKEENLLAILN